MNDIDIEEGRRLAWDATDPEWAAGLGEIHDSIGLLVGGVCTEDGALIVWLRNNAAAMFDAIETGRRWETIARQAWEDADRLAHAWLNPHVYGISTEDPGRANKALAEVLRLHYAEVADRTSTPTDGA